jgi:hypothetical protein
MLRKVKFPLGLIEPHDVKSSGKTEVSGQPCALSPRGRAPAASWSSEMRFC